MSSLPLRLPWDTAQDRWSTILTPALTSKIGQGHQLDNIALINGTTVINHKLGRKMQGYMIADQNAAASIYRSAALNDLTLTLTSSAACTVAIWVY